MRTSTRPLSLLIAVLALFALVAAACGSSDDDASGDNGGVIGGDSTAADDPTPTPEPAEDPEPAEGSDTPDEPQEPEEPEEPEEMVLTDSFRGVTSTTIKLGYSFIDFDTLNNDFGLGLTYASFEPFVYAFADEINARGGINGRMLEIVAVPFLPVGPASAEEACLKLTEDNEVFAVLGGFAGAGAEAINLCITADHETILIGGIPTAETQAQSIAPWISDDISETRRAEAFGTILAETGVLDELGPMLFLSTADDFTPPMETARASVEAVGGDVRLAVEMTAGSDEVAVDSEVGIFLERARAEGVTTVVQFGQSPFASNKVLEFGDEFNLVFLNGDQQQDFRPQNLDESDRILGTGRIFDTSDPEAARCIEIAQPFADDPIAPPTQLGEEDTNYWSGVMSPCREFKIFEQIATLAGADLTNDSFAAAIAELPPFALAEFPFVSLRPDKLDARDSLSLLEWDHSINEWTTISDPVNVTG